MGRVAEAAAPETADPGAYPGEPDRHACAHAADRALRAPDALAEAEAACRERDVRLTDIRRRVLRTLFETHRPLGAYDLADVLAAGRRRRVAPITVYRALDFLLEQGFVHRLATKNAFVACPRGHRPGEAIVFLLCEACGGVDEAGSPGLGAALGRVVHTASFAPRAQVLEITGRCAHCLPAPDRPPQAAVEHRHA